MPSTLGPIYKIVKEKHPTYCDGLVKCICGHKETKRPEWKHQVRWALWDLRYNGTLNYSKTSREYSIKKKFDINK